MMLRGFAFKVLVMPCWNFLVKRIRALKVYIISRAPMYLGEFRGLPRDAFQKESRGEAKIRGNFSPNYQ